MVVEHGLLIAGEHADVKAGLAAHALDDNFAVGDVAQGGGGEGEHLAVGQQVRGVAELGHDIHQAVCALVGERAVLADVGREPGGVLVVQYGRDPVAVHAVDHEPYGVGADVNYADMVLEPMSITLYIISLFLITYIIIIPQRRRAFQQISVKGL